MTNGYQKSVQALIKKIQIGAFIVAAIVVGVVVFSSISKEKIPEGQIRGQEEQLQEEQLEEQLEEQISVEEQLEEQPEERAEEVTPAVEITSASVTFKKRDFLDPDQYLCTVKMSGTATLRAIPDTTELKFVGCEEGPCIFENAGVTIANFTDSILTCPSWTYKEEYAGCDRRSGQPATGEWSLTFADWFYPWEGHKKTFFVDTTTKTDWVWDSVTLTCQP